MCGTFKFNLKNRNPRGQVRGMSFFQATAQADSKTAWGSLGVRGMRFFLKLNGELQNERI